MGKFYLTKREWQYGYWLIGIELMRFTSSAEVYGCFASYHSLMVDDIIDPILSSNVVFENAALRVLGLLFFMCGGCVIGGEAKATAKLGLRISSNESYGIHDGLKIILQK